MSGMMPPPGGGRPPPMDQPQGAMGQVAEQSQRAQVGKTLQNQLVALVQAAQHMLALLEQIPGINQDQFQKGKQALGIGFQMVAESMPKGQGGPPPDMGGPPPGPPPGMGGPPGGAMGGGG